MEDDLKEKMEDDLKKKWNGRRPYFILKNLNKHLKKNGKKWKMNQTKMEADLKKEEEKKMEDDLKKMKKNEDDIKKKICSRFLLNLGQTFPGIGSAL